MKVFRSCAPLRLGLAGGGTDVSPYCDNYGGYVLNATIDMYAHCSIIPTKDGVVTFEAKDKDEIENFFIDDEIDIHSGLELHKAVYKHIIKNFNGGIPLSHKLITYCDAPPGSRWRAAKPEAGPARHDAPAAESPRWQAQKPR